MNTKTTKITFIAYTIFFCMLSGQSFACQWLQSVNNNFCAPTCPAEGSVQISASVVGVGTPPPGTTMTFHVTGTGYNQSQTVSVTGTTTPVVTFTGLSGGVIYTSTATASNNACLQSPPESFSTASPVFSFGPVTATPVDCNNNGAINFSFATNVCSHTTVSTATRVEDGTVHFGNENGVFNLLPGHYNWTFAVTNGCSQLIFLRTSNNNPIFVADNTPTISSVSSTNPSCANNDGSITVTVPASLHPLVYSINGGASFQPSFIFNNLAAGSYNIVIKDIVTNCVTPTPPISKILVLPTISVSVTPQNPTFCAGSSVMLTAQGSGGSGVFSYQWIFNGNVISTQQTISVNTPGTYYAVAIEGACQSSPTPVTVTEIDCCTLSAPNLSIVSASACNADTGVIQISWTGGNGQIQYGINNVIVGNVPGNPFNLGGRAPGFITINLRDSLFPTCPQTNNTTFVPTTPPPVVSLGGNFDICGTVNPTLTAQIVSPGSGAPYTFNWSPPAPNQQTISISSPGTYSVTVTDKNGCTSSPASVVVNKQLNAGIMPGVACIPPGGSVTLTAVPNPSGTFNYEWKKGSTTVQNGSNPQLVVTAPDTYTVIITDAAHSCSATASITVSETTLAFANGTPTPTVTCAGQKQGTIEVDITGGTGPNFTYSDGVSSVTTTATTHTFTGLAAGSYNITVTDVTTGCFISAPNVMVPADNFSFANNSPSTTATCQGQDNGTVVVQTVSGTAPYIFLLDGIPSPAQPSPNHTFTGVAAGGHSVMVTDANGCALEAQVTVAQDTLSFTNNTPTTTPECMNQGNGTITVNTAGGTADYSFFLDSVLITTQASPNFVYQNVTAGPHHVTVTDANNCSISANVLVGRTALINVVIQGNCDNTVTVSGTASAGSTISVSGLPVIVTPFISVTGNFSFTIPGVPFGTFNVTVTATNPSTPNCSPFVNQKVTVGCPDMSIFKCCGSPATDQKLTFTVTVKNSGTGPAQGVVVQDILPDCFKFIKAKSVPGTNWTFSQSGQTITAQLLSELDPGDLASFTITVKVDCCPGQKVQNMATVTAPGSPTRTATCTARIA